MEAMVPETVNLPRPEPERPAIPGYEIVGVIGRGAAGVVYRARQLAVDREVALKVLHPELARNKRIVQRLQREARTTARLAHPHIVSAIDMGETDGRWWYAMELVEGSSLALILRQEGRLREREALRLFIPLCEALEHAWEHGVVHRDIKPANILVDRATGAWLADLGLAFADDDPSLTAQGGTLGTPHYISPEQAVDPRQADIRSDIWSFGATLYHAVCGRPPFGGDSTAEVLSGVLHARVPDPLRLEPDLSKGLVLVLRKCLTRDPDERYQTPRELLLDLERVRERRQPKVSRRALDPVERTAPPWRRAAAIGAALVFGLAAVWWAVGRLGGEAVDPVQPADAVVEAFEPLEEIAARIRREPADYGRQLRDLEGLEARVPAANRARWSELRADLVERLRGRVQAAVDPVSVNVPRMIDEGDFVGARRTLQVGLAAELSDTRFTVTELTERFGFLKGKLAELESMLDVRESASAATVKRKLDERAKTLAAEADALSGRKRYRSALALLDPTEEELFEELGYGGYRFPRDVEADLFGDLRTALIVPRQSVIAAWAAYDDELQRWVESRADTLREKIELGKGDVAAAHELRPAFDDHLFQQGLEREEMPTGRPSAALLRLIEDKERELAELEDGLRRDLMRRDFDVERELDQALWAMRDYRGVLRLWTDFRAELESWPGDPERPWRVSIARRVDVRLEEARWLQGLLASAAEGVVAADGSVRELHVEGGRITEEGRVRAGLDPLGDGFALEAEKSTFRIDLRTLWANDVLMLAGVPTLDEDLAPDQRLLVACFRFHEGDLSRAASTLDSGALPSEGIAGELAVDLNNRITDAIETQDRRNLERDRKIDDLLAKVEDDAMQARPDLALLAIAKLLNDYREAPRVQFLRSSLEEKRDALERRLQSFEALFGPDRFEEPRRGRARMTFFFDKEDVGSWESRDWRFDGVGWSRDGVAGDWESLAQRWGARLILKSPPLDVEQDLDVTVRFELVDASAPPQLFVVSLLGLHVALTGRGLPGGGGESRWVAGGGTAREFLATVRAGEGKTREKLLRPGEPQVLRVVGNARRGSLRVELDGVELGRLRLLSQPADKTAIVLRSWEPIRVTEVVVDGTRL